MAKRSQCEQKKSDSQNRLWLNIGRRLQFRREQIGISLLRASGQLGVTPEEYEAYERGDCLIPAKELAQVAELFAVPVFYFFETLEMADEKPEPAPSQPGSVYTVATGSERVIALVDDFEKLDFARQQLLLLVARALARDVGASS